MMPRLEARDSLVWAERLAVGVGRLRKADHTAIQSRWQRTADPAPAESVRTPGGLVAALSAAGVPVHLVPAKAVTRRRRKARKPS